jgi:hypothetical protein
MAAPAPHSLGIDGPLLLPFPDRWRGRCWPDGRPRACTLGQKGDRPRGARPMRWTYIPAVGAGIWIFRGGWRRVRPRRGACDTCLDARGATFAIADQGYAPSHRIIKLDCVIVEQIPAHTIGPCSEFFLGALLGPKGGNGGTNRGKQSDRRSIERSRRHRAQIGGYHGRSAWASRQLCSTPLTNHFTYLIKFGSTHIVWI